MGFFKAYDMRGTFGVDFDLPTVRRVGEALPRVVASARGGRPRWLVGRDARESSAAIRDALAEGLLAAGAAVTDLGPCTTPMVYHFTAAEDFDGSVMITASHNPPGDNGLKVSRRGALPVGYETGLAEVERLCASPSGASPSGASRAAFAPSDTPDAARLAAYVAFLKGFGFRHDGLRIAVDCSDGMAALFARELFPGALFLNDSPDGRFPHHAPNPLLAGARAQAADAVRAHGLDCAVIFDGDADRCAVVDETGAFIQPDFLIPAVARAVGGSGPVIHDVRTSRATIEALRAEGFGPVIGRVGHAYAKRLLRDVGATCGGELAGHYYFRDFHGCDSGALAALAILSQFAAAKRAGRSVSAYVAPVACRYANSGELNFRVADKRAAIARMLAAAGAFGPERARTEIDGVRIEYAEGWISIRESNTEPYLRLIAECADATRLARWREALGAAAAAEARR